MRVLVVGPGGCASTALIHMLSAYPGIQCNRADNADCQKHRRRPPEDLAKRYDACIFVYGPLHAAVASLFRRGYVKPQLAERNLGNPQGVDPNISLEAYISKALEAGRDLLGIQEQAEAWLAHRGPPGVLFLDVSFIGTRYFDQQLRRHLQARGLPATRAVQRETDLSGLPPAFVQLYEDLRLRIKREAADRLKKRRRPHNP